MAVRNWTDENGVVWGSKVERRDVEDDETRQIHHNLEVLVGKPFKVFDPHFVHLRAGDEPDATPESRHRAYRENEFAGSAVFVSVVLFAALLAILLGNIAYEAIS